MGDLEKGPAVTSLLSFLNLLTADLQLEEISSIEEAQNVLPILTNLVKTGDLAFVCDGLQEGGLFTKAVGFMKNEIGADTFSDELLDPVAADKGDKSEMAIIVLALLYALRLQQEAKFCQLCDRLDPISNSRIARMIALLDSYERFSPLPFASVLSDAITTTTSGSSPAPIVWKTPKAQPVMTTAENMPTADDKENCPPPNGNNRRTTPGRLASSSSGSGYSASSPAHPNATASSPFRLKTPSTLVRDRRYIITTFEGSPVNRVLNSPRGEEVVRIQALKEEVRALKEFRDQIGCEKDRLDEQCQAKDMEITLLRKQNESQDARIARIIVQAERVPSLEDRIMRLEEENSGLELTLRTERNKAATQEGHLATVQFERDEALRRVEMLQTDLRHLQAEYEKAQKRGQDEMALLEQTRRKLADYERGHGTEMAEMRARLREMEATVEEERMVTRARVEEKNREMEERLGMVQQIKEHAEEQSGEQHAKLVELQAALDECFEICEQQKGRINELEQMEGEWRRHEQEAIEHKKKNHQLIRDHALQIAKLQRELAERQNRLDSLTSQVRQLEHQLQQAEIANEGMQQKMAEVEEIEQKYLEVVEENVQLQKKQSVMTRHYTDEINMLLLKDGGGNGQMKSSEEWTTPSARANKGDTINGKPRNARTPASIRVVFAPEKKKGGVEPEEKSKSTSSLATATAMGVGELKRSDYGGGTSHSNYCSGSSATTADSGSRMDEDHDKRIRELVGRNRRNPPHLRSSYLPEAAHLKGTDPKLNSLL